MPIKVGDIVTVLPEGWDLSGEQGEVVAVDAEDDEGPIAVQFTRPAFFHYLPPEDTRIRYFEEVELSVVPHYTVQNVGKYFFPQHHHSTYAITFPFSSENDCMLEDCGAKCARRVVVNFWGSLYEYDLCEEHAAKWDRKMTESTPPCKPDYWPATVPRETATQPV